jgi:stress-induced morphogen
MVDERKDVKFPLWRKKVDGSLFQHGMTVIPEWVKDQVFDIREVFIESSKKKSTSEVDVIFHDDGNQTRHNGWITTTYFSGKWKEKRNPVMRFSFDNELKTRLQQRFTMSHMRDMERRMRKCKVSEIEEQIPFYEFLDIEWDLENREFHFKPHYVQSPIYTELFTYLQTKHILEQVENEIEGKKGRIAKGDWKEKSEIKGELHTENAIYTLIDRENKELYVGEATNLAKRFNQKRNEIPNWTHYRVDILPPGFDDKMRVNLERMLIRSLASLIENNVGVESMKISDYSLKNKRVDR